MMRACLNVLVALVALTLATGCGEPEKPIVEETQKLRILQWTHFVPQYDTWFNQFVTEWAAANNVEVEITQVPLDQVINTANAEFAAGAGHDLIQYNTPPSAREPEVMDLTELNTQAAALYGNHLELAKLSSYNAKTGKYWGFCHGWVPSPLNYLRSMWSAQSMADGPATWDQVRTGGAAIKASTVSAERPNGVPVGLGFGNDVDSALTLRTILWSFGASVQNAQNQIALDSAATRAALNHAKQLYQDAMTTDVTNVSNWSSSSNNQGLVAGNLSYIHNPVSAYRTAQASGSPVADEIFFHAPPGVSVGTTGMSPAAMYFVYVIPKWSKASDAAKKLLLALAGSYKDAVYNAKLYNLPAFPGSASETAGWLANDPFAANESQRNRLAFLANAGDWTGNIGWPGTTNPAAGEVFDKMIINQMFRDFVTGKKTADEAITWAMGEITPIYEKWRAAGLL